MNFLVSGFQILLFLWIKEQNRLMNFQFWDILKITKFCFVKFILKLKAGEMGGIKIMSFQDYLMSIP